MCVCVCVCVCVCMCECVCVCVNVVCYLCSWLHRILKLPMCWLPYLVVFWGGVLTTLFGGIHIWLSYLAVHVWQVTLFGTACMRDGVHVRGGVHGYLIWHSMYEGWSTCTRWGTWLPYLAQHV